MGHVPLREYFIRNHSFALSTRKPQSAVMSSPLKDAEIQAKMENPFLGHLSAGEVERPAQGCCRIVRKEYVEPNSISVASTGMRPLLIT
jgi:hypothetical protein